MSALLTSLANSCSKLRVLRINDNWLKSQSIEPLFKLVFACPELEHLNLSDLNMGQEPVLATLEAIKESERTVLREFHCNYNEVDSKLIARDCTKIMLEELAERRSGERRLETI